MALLATCCDILIVGHEDEENLSIRSVAAFLMNEGIRVGIEPYKSSRKEAILERIIRDDPTIIGFSISFQASIPDFAELTDYLRRNEMRRHFTAGGHIPTIAPETVFEMVPGLDTVVRHEGEHTLLELYKNVDKPDLWPGIRGLVVRRNGVIEAAPPRPLIEDLDALPFPIRPDSFETFRGLGICQMLASRGCPYKCSFCSIHQFYSDAIGPKRRLRSPANIVREMEQLFQKGVRIFSFIDDGLITRSRSERRWAEEFAQALEKSGLADEIIWSMFCRVDEVDADILGRLKDCGLGFIGIGIESGNEQGLKTLNKHYAVEDIFRAMDIVQHLGLCFEYGFMMFDPDSTFQSVKANLDFLKRLCESGSAPVRLTKMVPLMATPIARRLHEEGRLVGTIASPNFTYEDKRLDLLDLFFARAFGSVFGKNGVVDRLRSAMKDAVVIDKFFPGRYDAKAYGESITGLTRAFNDSAFETLYKAARFMEDRSEEDILYYWHMLDMLCRQELETQSEIAQALEKSSPAEIQA
jgi:radical SAM superfamily enzyme YgiQ (UPF0313 family)